MSSTPGGQWSVAVDPQRCQGTGLCLSLAPGHFRLVDYRAQPVDVVHQPSEDLLAAVEVCPMEAISVSPDATGESANTHQPEE